MENIILPGKTEYEKILIFDNYLRIIYKGEEEPIEYAYYERSRKSHQISWIEMNQDSLPFNINGHLHQPYAIYSYGYWAWERAAEMLPLDYNLQ